MPSKYAMRNVGNHPDEIGIVERDVNPNLTVTSYFSKVADLRYGTNPGETAAFYGTDTLLGTMKELKTGKQGPSQTNMEDVVYGLDTLKYFSMPAAIIMKHENACGFARRTAGETGQELYARARNYDFRSSFGGTVNLNFPVDKDTAEEIIRTFVEGVAAPEYEEGVLGILNSPVSKSKTLRAYKYDPEKLAALPKFTGDEFSPLLKQLPDGTPIRYDPHLIGVRLGDLHKYLKTKREPTVAELEDMMTALYVDVNLRSNSCCFIKNGYMVGVGVGQNSRIDAFEQAIEMNKRLHRLAPQYAEKLGFDPRGDVAYSLDGSVVATDAFAPALDAPMAAYEAGVNAMLFIEGGEAFKSIVEEMGEIGVSYIALPPEERHFSHH